MIYPVSTEKTTETKKTNLNNKEKNMRNTISKTYENSEVRRLSWQTN